MAELQPLCDMDSLRLQSARTDKLIVFCFTASWCGPCKIIKGKIQGEKLKVDFSRVEFFEIDVDSCGELSTKCAIREMPTFQTRKLVGEESVLEKQLLGADIKKLEELITSGIEEVRKNKVRADFWDATQKIKTLTAFP